MLPSSDRKRAARTMAKLGLTTAGDSAMRPPNGPIRLVLPVPPSTNALYTYRVGSRQRIKTDAYRAWINEAGWAVAAAGPVERARHPWRPWRVEIEMPFDRRRDIDNAIKPILDLLVRMGIMKDDRWVDDLRVRRVPAGEALTVCIWPMEKEDGIVKG